MEIVEINFNGLDIELGVSNKINNKKVEEVIKKYNNIDIIANLQEIDASHINYLILEFKNKIRCIWYNSCSDGKKFEKALIDKDYSSGYYECYEVLDFYEKNRNLFEKVRINYDADINKDQLTIFDMEV